MTDDLAARDVIEAMDGIVLLMDADLRVRDYGRANWARVWRRNCGEDPPDIDGKDVAAVFTPGHVRDTFTRLFREVLGGGRPAVETDFRCDSPEFRRQLRLSVRPLGRDARCYLLYQSIELEVEQRPRIDLFAARPVAPGESPLRMCTICARIGWPPGPAPPAEWIDPTDYYRRDGSDVALISHGFCPDCYARLTAEPETD